MKLAHVMMAVAAIGMSAAPAMAAPANPAASLSIGNARASSPTGNHKSKLAGGGAFVAIIAAVVVIAGIVVVATNKDKPASA